MRQERGGKSKGELESSSLADFIPPKRVKKGAHFQSQGIQWRGFLHKPLTLLGPVTRTLTFLLSPTSLALKLRSLHLS